MNAVNIVINKR